MKSNIFGLIICAVMLIGCETLVAFDQLTDTDVKPQSVAASRYSASYCAVLSDVIPFNPNIDVDVDTLRKLVYLDKMYKNLCKGDYDG